MKRLTQKVNLNTYLADDHVRKLQYHIKIEEIIEF